MGLLEILFYSLIFFK